MKGIPPPAWGNVLVNSGKQGKPVGDPTQWGAGQLTLLDAALVQTFSPQFVSAATQDTYARSWAILGTLRLPQATWNAPGTFPAGPFPLVVALDIVMGVGQASVQHQIILMCGNNPNVGLCNTQNAINGGPYLSTFETGSGDETRPFAAIGALVGHTIQMRVRYVGGTNVGLPTTAQVQALITPFAAGAGL